MAKKKKKWSPVGATVWEGLGCVFFEGVLLGDFEVSETQVIPRHIHSLSFCPLSYCLACADEDMSP